MRAHYVNTRAFSWAFCVCGLALHHQCCKWREYDRNNVVWEWVQATCITSLQLLVSSIRPSGLFVMYHRDTCFRYCCWTTRCFGPHHSTLCQQCWQFLPVLVKEIIAFTLHLDGVVRNNRFGIIVPSTSPTMPSGLLFDWAIHQIIIHFSCNPSARQSSRITMPSPCYLLCPQGHRITAVPRTSEQLNTSSSLLILIKWAPQDLLAL